MYKAKRLKRDTVENIYRQCQVTGNCPPDVVNKVEQTTLADILLKIFGSVIYLGGLGIGSGSGAGSTGFRPISETVPVESIPPETTNVEAPIIRPSRPSRPTTFGTRIDPISSAGNRPRPVNPRGPAIVPLSENGLPDPTIISTGAGPGTGINDFEVLTTVDTFEDINTVSGHPTVLHGQEDIAILEVTPIDSVPHRIVIEHPHTEASINIIESTLPPPDSLNVFVDPNFTGIHVGEEIELQPINTIDEFEIEENIPRTSTPARVLDAAIGRVRSLYNRIVEQAPTRNVDFLGQPSRAIVFEYENPAFQDDVSLTFERDLNEIAAAPDPTFTDVIQLNRPQFSETKEGLVRFSRLGSRGKISTRSGTLLRQKVHFYYDVSPIQTISETIELQPINDSSDVLTIVDELSRSTFINPVFEENITEDALIDDVPNTFSDSHLALLGDEEEEQIVVPTLVSNNISKPFVGDYFSTFTTIGDTTEAIVPLVPNSSLTPVLPAVYIDPFGADFYLHPALLKRKKRKYSEIF